MKKIYTLIYVIAITFILSSCETVMEKDIREVNKMKCPVIIHSKSKSDSGINLIDGDGNFKFLNGMYKFTATLNDSFEVGDTIKFCSNINN